MKGFSPSYRIETFSRNEFRKLGFRRHGSATRVLVAVLATLIALEPVALASTPSPTGVELQLSTDDLMRARFGMLTPEQQKSALPDGGSLDAKHNILETSGPMYEGAFGLYAARNTLVRNMLRTRLGLKQLMDPATQRAIGKQADVKVPWEARALYAGQGPQIHEFADLIRRIDGGAAQPDAFLRQRLLRNLVIQSAEIRKYDLDLRYYEEDFWKDPSVDRMFMSWVNSQGYRVTGNGCRTLSDYDYDGRMSREPCKQAWIKQHGVDKTIARLAVVREFQNQYPILSVQVDGKPLYIRLYEEFERAGILPSTATPQRSSVEKLPEGAAELPVPQHFRQALSQSLPNFTDDSEFLKLLTRSHMDLKPVFDRVNLFLERGLLSILEANTELLRDLTQEREIEYLGRDSGSLVYLALNDAIWDEAKTQYGWLALKGVDFDRARDGVIARIDYAQAQRDKRKFVLIGMAATFAAIAIIGSDGAVLPFLGAAAKGATVNGGFSWGRFILGLSLWPAAGAAYLRYVDSSEMARMHKLLFFSTSAWKDEQGRSVTMGSYSEMFDAKKEADRDFRNLLISAILIGLDFPLIDSLVRISGTVAKTGKAASEVLAPAEVARVQTGLRIITPRIRVFGRLGARLRAQVQAGLATGRELRQEFMTVAQAVKRVWPEFKVNPSIKWGEEEAWQLLQQYPVLGPMFASARSAANTTAAVGRAAVRPFYTQIPNFGQMMRNAQANPVLIRRMLRDALIAFGVEYAAEWQTIPDPQDNKFRILINSVASAIGTAFITFSSQGTPVTVFSKGLSIPQRIQVAHERGVNLFYWGIVSFGPANLGMEVLPAVWKGDPEWKDIAIESAANTAIGGVSFYFSSMPRSQGIAELQLRLDGVQKLRAAGRAGAMAADEAVLASLFRDPKTTNIFMGSVSFQNNLIGGAIYGKYFQAVPEELGVKRFAHTDLGLLQTHPALPQRISDRASAAYVFDFLSAEEPPKPSAPLAAAPVAPATPSVQAAVRTAPPVEVPLIRGGRGSRPGTTAPTAMPVQRFRAATQAQPATRARPPRQQTTQPQRRKAPPARAQSAAPKTKPKPKPPVAQAAPASPKKRRGSSSLILGHGKKSS
ncbi:MAG TPA: hypothetical protein VM598_13715 [Bdellovibrionota bacterium]|nr:hypothetical protein [Bdellovibrionota bacterium]